MVRAGKKAEKKFSALGNDTSNEQFIRRREFAGNREEKELSHVVI